MPATRPGWWWTCCRHRAGRLGRHRPAGADRPRPRQRPRRRLPGTTASQPAAGRRGRRHPLGRRRERHAAARPRRRPAAGRGGGRPGLAGCRCPLHRGHPARPRRRHAARLWPSPMWRASPTASMAAPGSIAGWRRPGPTCSTSAPARRWAMERFEGGAGADALLLPSGLAAAATLLGAGGNDTLSGGAAGDVLEGQDGNDLLAGRGGQRHAARRRRRRHADGRRGQRRDGRHMPGATA